MSVGCRSGTSISNTHIWSFIIGISSITLKSTFLCTCICTILTGITWCPGRSIPCLGNCVYCIIACIIWNWGTLNTILSIFHTSMSFIRVCVVLITLKTTHSWSCWITPWSLMIRWKSCTCYICWRHTSLTFICYTSIIKRYISFWCTCCWKNSFSSWKTHISICTLYTELMYLSSMIYWNLFCEILSFTMRQRSNIISIMFQWTTW